MKKSLLLIALFFQFFALLAQPCTPDPNMTKPGVSPSKLPDGTTGVYYSEVISLMVPLDTSIVYNGSPVNIRIDSARVISITNIPPNFSYECDKPSQTWNGGQKGCAKVFGTPDPVHEGKFEISVKVQTWFKIVGLSNQFDQIDSSTIDFEVKFPNSLQDLSNNTISSVYPNPANSKLYLSLPKFDANAVIKVSALDGKNVDLPVNLNGQSGMAELTVEQLPAGVYLIEANLNNRVWTGKFIKN